MRKKNAKICINIIIYPKIYDEDNFKEKKKPDENCFNEIKAHRDKMMYNNNLCLLFYHEKTLLKYCYREKKSFYFKYFHAKCIFLPEENKKNVTEFITLVQDYINEFKKKKLLFLYMYYIIIRKLNHIIIILRLKRHCVFYKSNYLKNNI